LVKKESRKKRKRERVSQMRERMCVERCEVERERSIFVVVEM